MNDITVNSHTFKSYYSVYNDQTKGIKPIKILTENIKI